MIVEIFGIKFLFEALWVSLSFIPALVTVFASFFRKRTQIICLCINAAICGVCFLVESNDFVGMMCMSLMGIAMLLVSVMHLDGTILKEERIKFFFVPILWACFINIAIGGGIFYYSNVVYLEPEIETTIVYIEEESKEKLPDELEKIAKFYSREVLVEFRHDIEKPYLEMTKVSEYTEDRNYDPPRRDCKSTEITYKMYVNPKNLTVPEE